MIRIGLMGCGTVAQYGHLPVIKASPEFELHAVFEPNAERLAATQAKFEVPHGFQDVEAFLGSGVDAVTITSPAPCHRENVLAAAAYGKPILCEKPLCMTASEGQEMVEACERAGVMLFTGFDYRFSPVSLKIKELVEKRAVGDVRSLRLIYIWHLHGKWAVDEAGREVLNSRYVGRMEEGGPMVDCGAHQVDLARWWMGDVERWSAAGAWVEGYEAPDHMYLHMDHSGGAHTMVEMSFSYTHTAKDRLCHFTYQLIGTKGLIRYDREQRLFEVRDGEGTKQLAFAGEKNFEGMYQAFAQALGKGEPGALATGRDGVEVTRIAREATEAVIAGRTTTADGNPTG